MTEPLCRTCRFWNASQPEREVASSGPQYGNAQCRRRAPVWRKRGPEDWSNWTTTNWRDWCGEHEMVP
jgi:hypothetical protein